MNASKKTRSRTGCLTCRKRKKKCDEASYPMCQNCQSKKLSCIWPSITHELHKKITQVKYIAEDTPEEEYKSLDEELDVVSRIPSSAKISKPPLKNNKSKYFLQRIAMQQDCVNDSNEVSQVHNEKPKVDNAPILPYIDESFLDVFKSN
ncbi:hypothetical protein JA1_003074 [Spathaspora sp. JA1]|nr:hypothetical protein JA1_003074 [Spathaspora sp. JA1]